MTLILPICTFGYLMQVALLLDIEWGDTIRKIVTNHPDWYFALIDDGLGNIAFKWKPPATRRELWWKWLWPFVIGIVPWWGICAYLEIWACEKGAQCL